MANKLPAAVQKQIDDANAAIEAGRVSDGSGAPAPTADPGNTGQPPTPVAEPAPVVVEPTPGGNTVQPAPVVAQPAQPVVAEPAQLDISTTDPNQLRHMLEQKEQTYRVLQGKYDAEVPRLFEQNRQLHSQNVMLTELLQNRGEGAGETQRTDAPVKQDVDLTRWFPQETIDAYDEETLKAQARVFESMQNETGQLRHQLFTNQIRTLVPNLDKLDNDQTGFLPWLDAPMTAEDISSLFAQGRSLQVRSGMTRRDVLNMENQNQDANGVAAIFNLYKAPTQPAVVDPLAQQLTPAPAGTIQAPTSQPNQKVYSGAEYKAISDQLARGKFPADKAELWKKELNLALQEGRVRD